MPEPCQHGIQLIVIAADQCFDTAIGTVAHPAADAEFIRLFVSVVAEADPLHPAFDSYFIGFQS